MSDVEVSVDERSLAKGLIAGLIGGLAGTVAKTLAERVFPPRTHGEPDHAQEAAGAITGHELSPTTEAIVEDGIHWGFGAAVGAAYGALAEFYPAATAKEGATFGMALEGLTHEKALPVFGLSAEPEDQTLRERLSEVSSHVIYGVTTEFVRSFVRKLL